MALSGSIAGTTSNAGIIADIDWTATQSIANNTSTITYKLYYKRTDDLTTYGSGTFNVNSLGSQSKYVSIASSWVLAGTWTQTVTHNADGTKSLSVSATGSVSGTTLTSTSLSGTIYLDTIPRGSVPSCPASATFGGTIKVTTNRKVSSYTHTLKFTMAAGTSGKAQASSNITGVGADYTFTIPASWAAAIPKGTSAKIVCTVTTYSGSTQIGNTATCSATVTIPTTWAPTVNLAAAAVNGFNSAYVQNVSSVKLTASSGTATTGATVSKYEFSGTGVSQSGTGTTVTSSVLSKSGSLTYTCKITDSRGLTGTKTVTISVTAYSAPSVRLSVTRCDQNGDVNDYGVYGKATITGSYSNISGNKTTTTVQYKLTTATSWTTLNTYSNETNATISKTSSTFSAAAGQRYNVKVTVTDTVGKSASATLILSTAYAIIDVYQDLVLALGSAASTDLPYYEDGQKLLYSGYDENVFYGKVEVLGSDRLYRNVNDYIQTVAQRFSNVLTATNCNDISENGFYTIASSGSNKPFSTAGIVAQFGSPTGVRYQVFVATPASSKDCVAYRTHNGTSWSSWYRPGLVDEAPTIASTRLFNGALANNATTTFTVNPATRYFAYAVYSSVSSIWIPTIVAKPWTDGSKHDCYIAGTTYPFSMSLSGTTMTFKREGTSSVNYYVYGMGV